MFSPFSPSSILSASVNGFSEHIMTISKCPLCFTFMIMVNGTICSLKRLLQRCKNYHYFSFQLGMWMRLWYHFIPWYPCGCKADWTKFQGPISLKWQYHM